MSAVILHPSATFGEEEREALFLPQPGGHALAVTLHRPPAGKGPARGAMLLLPGWSGARTGPAELLVFLARQLTAAGHAALRLDFHGRGDSTGLFAECGLDGMIAQSAAGLDLLRERFPGVPLAAGGICSGGNVALGLASLRPRDVTAVLALSALPFQPARTGAFERRRRWRNVKRYLAKAVRPSTWLRLARGEVDLDRVKKNVTASEKPGAGERNLKDSARDIERELRAWTGRALFVWGGGDEEGGPARAHFERLLPPSGTVKAAFAVIPGANHNFYGQAWRAELGKRIVRFLAAGN